MGMQGSDGQLAPEKTGHLWGLCPNTILPHFMLVLTYNPSPAGLLPAGIGDIPRHKPGCPLAMIETPGCHQMNILL